MANEVFHILDRVRAVTVTANEVFGAWVLLPGDLGADTFEQVFFDGVPDRFDLT